MKRTANCTLSHIFLFCSNLDRAAAFYTEGLGLRTVRKNDSVAELADQAGLVLFLAHSRSRAELIKGYSPVLQFKVESIQATVARLQKYGAVLEGGLMSREGCNLQGLVGPEGEIIALTEWHLPGEDESGPRLPSQIEQILRKVKL